jgi:hypothetical protein
MTDPMPVPPREPFAYMSDQRSAIPKIREPVLEILFGLFFVAFGVVILVIEIVKAHNNTGGSVGVGVFLLLLAAGLGSFAIYMGMRRQRWKREYRRVMGRNPW